MSTITKRVVFFLCLRCGHEWQSRTQKHPKICPTCKQETWDTPKPEKASA